MRRALHIAIIAVFIAALAAPLATFALLGPADPYGRPFATYRGVRHGLLHSPERRKEFFDAIFQRAPATPFMIAMKNRWQFYGLRSVQTDQVVSGEDGWLFLRRTLQAAEECYSPETLAEVANAMQTMIGLYEATGGRMIITIAPDKSKIYPEQLSGHARAHFSCTAPNAEALRASLSALAPGVMDHTGPLLAFKAEHPDALLYLVRDTHWLGSGAMVALDQLSAELGGAPVIEDGLGPMVPIRNNGDLSRMLLLRGETPAQQPQAATERLGRAPPIPTDDMVIVYDSFYAVSMFRAPLSGARMVHVSDVGDYQGILPPADGTFVWESVERDLLGRLTTPSSAIRAALGRAIVSRNSRMARRDCVFDTDPIPLSDAARKSIQNATENRDGSLRAGVDGQITIGFDDKISGKCLELDFTADRPVEAEILLPAFAWDQTGERWNEARVIPWRAGAGQNRAVFVLPQSLSRDSIRFDPSADPVRLDGLTVRLGDYAPAAD